jgi:hypothetical protein
MRIPGMIRLQTLREILTAASAGLRDSWLDSLT